MRVDETARIGADAGESRHAVGARGAYGPVVCQAIDDICALIARGDTLPGGRLPSERELAAQFGVSRSTVRSALAQMRDEGLVEVRRGRSGGAYLLDGEGLWERAGRMDIESRSSRLIDRQAGTPVSFASMMAARGIEHETRVVHAAREVCSPEVCELFGSVRVGDSCRDVADETAGASSPAICGAELFRIERVRSARGDAVSFEQTYLDPRRFPRFLDLDLTGSISNLLCEECGAVMARVQETVEVVGARGKPARYLGFEEGYPILRVTSRVTDDAGETLVVSRDSYNPNLVRLTVSSG